MAEPSKGPPGDNADGDRAWMKQQNEASHASRTAEREAQARQVQERQQQVETPAKKTSWLDRAAELKDNLKSSFSAAATSIADAMKPIEPGHGPTTVDVYNNKPEVRADPTLKM